MTKITVETEFAKATLISTTSGQFNESKKWRVIKNGISHIVETSTIYSPAETLVFRKGISAELAGGPGMDHFSAIEEYLKKETQNEQ